MKVLLFLILSAQCWSFPSLKTPKNWKPQPSPVPSIVKQFKAAFGYSEVEISYTQFGIPQIVSIEQFKAHLMSQYPKQSDGFPKVKIEKIQSCKPQNSNCFIALVDVKNQSGQSWVVLQYFRQNKNDYQGMSMIPKKQETEILAQKIMKGMQNAIPN